LGVTRDGRLPYSCDMKTESDAIVYEIRLKGHLGPNALIWFEGFDVAYSPDGETILRGPIVDQAALAGILARICDLGLSLTLFRELGRELL
jgi:hypothetical protein